MLATTDALDTILRLHDHRRWFRRKMIELAKKLDSTQLRQSFPMGPESIFGILAHCYGAETIWMNAIEKVDPAANLPTADSFATLDELLAEWKKTDARWDSFLKQLKESDLGRPIDRIREGKTYTTSLGDILIHVCTHQMYHAAQFKNMLRSLGVADLPPSDYIVFAREQWKR